MYYKAIILEIKPEYSLAMTDDGALIRIKNKDDLSVGDRVYILPEDLYVNVKAKKDQNNSLAIPKFSKRTINYIGSLAAAFLICISLFLFPQFTETAYAIVSFDSGVGLQVELDQNYNIIHISSKNSVFSASDLEVLKGKNIRNIGKDLDHFLGNGFVLVGYANHNDTTEETALLQTLQTLFSDRSVVYLLGHSEDIKASEKKDLSLGSFIAGKMISSDSLEDILEDIDRKDLMRLLQENPKWMDVQEFKDAYEDAMESVPHVPDNDDEIEHESSSAASPKEDDSEDNDDDEEPNLPADDPASTDSDKEKQPIEDNVDKDDDMTSQSQSDKDEVGEDEPAAQQEESDDETDSSIEDEVDKDDTYTIY